MTEKLPMEAGSVWQKIPEFSWKRLFACLLASLCFLCGLKEFMSMPRENSLSVFLEGSYPDQNRAEEILKNVRKQENTADVCFYWDGGFMKAEDTGYGHQTEVYVAGLQGNARLYDWRLGGLAEDDQDGCVISRKTAEELFGTPNATGNILTVKGENYTVRQVIPWKETLLLIRPRKKDTVYTRVFLKMQGDTGKTKVSQFLMENGLTGLVNGETIKEWIPDQWSDFGFWMKKWKEMKTNFRWYLMLPKTAVQAERIQCVFRGMAAFILSLLLYIWQKKESINRVFTGFSEITKKS